ncbi:hypothetical protein D3OALGB2SA_4819 [Olavius algarvensis associated proteobacterium Delta 3]|nr:hypothetical protein D3OALGB2SA_4819 [Olavius algarvensis associated proteobacterium Delta 3]
MEHMGHRSLRNLSRQWVCATGMMDSADGCIVASAVIYGVILIPLYRNPSHLA